MASYALVVPAFERLSRRYYEIAQMAMFVKQGDTRYLAPMFTALAGSRLIPLVPMLQEIISEHFTAIETIAFLQVEAAAFRDMPAFVPASMQWEYNAHRLIYAAVSQPSWLTLGLEVAIDIPMGSHAIAPGLPGAFRRYIAECPNFLTRPLRETLWCRATLDIPAGHTATTPEAALALPPREQIIIFHASNSSGIAGFGDFGAEPRNCLGAMSGVIISAAGLLTILAELQGLYTYL